MLCRMCCERCALHGAPIFLRHQGIGTVGGRKRPPGGAIVGAMFPGSEHLICYHVHHAREAAGHASTSQPPILGFFPAGGHHRGCRTAIRTCCRGTPGLRRSSRYVVISDADRPEQLPISISMGDPKRRSGALRVRISGAADARPYNPLPYRAWAAGHSGQRPGGWSTRRVCAVRLGGIEGPSHGRTMACLGSLERTDVSSTSCRHLPGDIAGRPDGLAGGVCANPFVGRALTALHRKPANPLDHRVIGKKTWDCRGRRLRSVLTPVSWVSLRCTYLTNWRMQLAANHFRSGVESVSAVANLVGYESEGGIQPGVQKKWWARPAEPMA